MRPDLRTLFIAAVFLRVVVFVVLGPTGSDHHYEVIESILREGRFPMAERFTQAFHPPAYYVLSLPWAMLGGDRFVEVFSLLLSILNLWLLFTLIQGSAFIQNDRARWHGLALTAFLPHLVIYSILVSNDTLAMVAGALSLLVALRFHADPRLSNAALAGLVAALGLLTKGTLIAQAGVLLFVVAVVSWRRLPVRRAAACVVLFLAVTVSLGSYKFIENQVRYGRPIVHGMDFGQDWVKAQQPTIVGVRSLIDINIVTLLREPYAERREGGWTNPQSVPLLLYATFWHPYVPVSNFRGTWARVPMIAQATYLLAIPATLLIVAGWLAAARRPLVWIPLAFFAANLALVIAAGVKYDAWSCFQSRLLFPAFAAITFGFAWGIEAADRKWPGMTRFVDTSCIALYAAFLTYFTIEIVSVVIKVLG
jgi:4-amino-4-deoxy-L-arabinose transferase-like glycosyltransferase